jgi:hypothetical protein
MGQHKTRARRAAKRKQDRRAHRRHAAEARQRYYASLPGEFVAGPDGAFCPHYRPGQESVITAEWTVRTGPDGRYEVAACPGCIRYTFGPAAPMVREWNRRQSAGVSR